MQTSIPLFSQDTILTGIEEKKRQDQSEVRPRVHEKIQNFFRDMSSGVISPILRLKTNRSLCKYQYEL